MKKDLIQQHAAMQARADLYQAFIHILPEAMLPSHCYIHLATYEDTLKIRLYSDTAKLLPLIGRVFGPHGWQKEPAETGRGYDYAKVLRGVKVRIVSAEEESRPGAPIPLHPFIFGAPDPRSEPSDSELCHEFSHGAELQLAAQSAGGSLS